MLLKIIQHPHPVLREKAKEVSNPKDPVIKKLANDMVLTMQKNEGVGLAANQIGKSLQIIVIEAGQEPLVLFNPKILRYSWRKTVSEEGCLSLKDVIIKVRRSRSIKVEACDKTGQKIRFKAKGFLARVIQHEVDHLNGILIIDKAKPRNQ